MEVGEEEMLHFDALFPSYYTCVLQPTFLQSYKWNANNTSL